MEVTHEGFQSRPYWRIHREFPLLPLEAVKRKALAAPSHGRKFSRQKERGSDLMNPVGIQLFGLR